MDKREWRIKKAEELGLKTQEPFEEVVDEVARIRLQKVHEYGETRYESTDLDLDLWLCFSDVHRKYIRLRRLMEARDLPALREQYLDIANYGLMGVQVIDRYLGTFVEEEKPS